MNNVTSVLKSQAAKYVGVGILAFSGGTGLGYFIGRKKKNKEMNVSEESDVSENTQLSLFEKYPAHNHPLPLEKGAKSNVPNLNPDRPWMKETLVLNEDSAETKAFVHSNNLKEWVKPTVAKIEPEDDVKYLNIFKSNDDQWDYEAEMAVRTPNAPYVIHRDEYVCEEMGYEQTTVTYYAGDDIMTDINDVPIYNHGSMISPLKFGHGSGDQNVVYIRNETLELEWEVLLSTGRYSVEVLGLEVERHYDNDNLAHSRSVLKFRDE